MLTENEIIVYSVPGKTQAVPENYYVLSYPKQKEMHLTDKNGRHIGWVRLLNIKVWKGKTKVNKTDLNYT